MDLEENNISIGKNVMSFKHNINLLALKKVSVYLFFSWLLMLNIGPLAKIVDKIYFFASSTVIILPLVFIFQKIYKDKGLCSYDKYLIIFISISLISCLVNFHGIPGNIKRIIWTSIYTFFIFSDDDLHEVIKNIKWIFLISVFILSLISISMFFVQYSEEFILNDWPVRIGFVENRLFGAYKHLNSGVILSIMCSYLCIQNIIELRYRVFSVINLVVQMIYMSLSNSRTCQVSLFISFALFCFIFFYEKNLCNTKGTYEIIFRSLVVSMLCSFLLLFLLKCISYVLIESVNSFNLNYNTDSSRISLDRLDISHSHEYSNGRFAIWVNALKIFKSNWILGVSPGNILNYANKYFPNEIISIKKYDSMHNTLIDIMASVGLFGTLSFIIFFIKNIFALIKLYIFRYQFNFIAIKKLEVNTLISSIISVVVACIFESEIIFVNSLETFLFWLFLAEIRRNIKKDNKENS